MNWNEPVCVGVPLSTMIITPRGEVVRRDGPEPDALPPLDTVVHIAGAVDEMQNCHDY